MAKSYVGAISERVPQLDKSRADVGVDLVAAVELVLQFAALALEVGHLFLQLAGLLLAVGHLLVQRGAEVLKGDKLPFIHLIESDIVKVGMSGESNAGPVVAARNAAFEEDAMKSWGVLPSDDAMWWVILWIVMTAFFAGVAWLIMEVIDYYYVLTARSAFAIWVGLSWLLVWQVGARIAAHERRRFGRS